MRALLSVVVLGLAFSLGCFGVDRGVDIGAVDVATDTAGDIDDSAADDSGGAARELCPAFSGFHGPSAVGHWRTRPDWEAQVGYGGSSTRFIEDWEETEDGATFSVVMDGVYDPPGYEAYASHQVLRYRCDPDALWLLEYRLDYSYAQNGQTVEGWTQMSYHEPVPTLRPGLEVGMRWSGEVVATYSSSAGDSREGPVAFDYWVEAEEELDLPAGHFRTLKLTNEGGDFEIWFAEDEGEVRTLTLELVDWTR